MQPEGSAWRRTIQTFFGLDVRSLALFRIALGIVLLCDVVVRYQDLQAFYTDDGLMPRATLPPFNTNLCVHVFDGSLLYQAILFYLHGFAALAIVLGWQTRIAVPLAWVLTTSVQARNILILHGGDALLRLLLFWSMFLPLSACYSLDSLARARAPKRVTSMGTVAFVVQICLVYWFAGLLKYDDAWRKDGYALFMALSVGHFATPLAVSLLDHHELLSFLTRATIILEMFGPFLLFIPWRNWFFRLLACFLYVSFHIGIGLTMRMGIFQWVCIVTWLAFLPTELWDWMGRRLHRRVGDGLKICTAAGQQGTFSLRFWNTFLMLPNIDTVSIRDNPALREQLPSPSDWYVLDRDNRIHAGMDGLVLLFQASPLFWPFAFLLRFKPVHLLGVRLFRRKPDSLPVPEDSSPSIELPPAVRPVSGPMNLLIAALLLYVIAWNFTVWDEPHGRGENFVLKALLDCRDAVRDHFPMQAHTLGHALGLQQTWGLFAPLPGITHGWLVIVGTLEDRSQVDMLHGGPVNWEKPSLIANTYPNSRWRQYLMHLSTLGPLDVGMRHHAALYFMEVWNSEHPDAKDELKTVEIYFMREMTQTDYKPLKLEKWRLSTFDCETLLSELTPARADP